MEDRSGAERLGPARVVLGVDGGGSKTHAVVSTVEGHVLGAAARGPSNWEEIGLPRAADTLDRVVTEALESADVDRRSLSATVFGLAGVDWDSDQDRLGNVLTRLQLGGTRLIVNDAFVALRAGLTGTSGIVVIAGTGTVVAGRNKQGAIFRTLGIGQYFGDYGSGSDISERAVLAVAEAYLGKGPSTVLADVLCAHERVGTVPELLEKISREQDDLPYVAQQVIETAEAGDEVAREIIVHAGRELGANANLAAERLGLAGTAFELVLAGGLFRSPTPILVDPLIAAVRVVSPDCRPIRLEKPPVVGAVLMAIDLADGSAENSVGDLVFSELDDTLLASPPERV